MLAVEVAGKEEEVEEKEEEVVVETPPIPRLLRLYSAGEAAVE